MPSDALKMAHDAMKTIKGDAPAPAFVPRRSSLDRVDPSAGRTQAHGWSSRQSSQTSQNIKRPREEEKKDARPEEKANGVIIATSPQKKKKPTEEELSFCSNWLLTILEGSIGQAEIAKVPPQKAAAGESTKALPPPEAGGGSKPAPGGKSTGEKADPKKVRTIGPISIKLKNAIKITERGVKAFVDLVNPP